MKMLDLRVKVDKRHADLYNDMTQTNVVPEFHVLFFLGASVGFRQQRMRKPTTRVDKFWSRTFEANEWACLYAMALTHWGGRLEQLQDDKSVIELMEEYATGGIDYLVETTLSEYLHKDRLEPRLDHSAIYELPRELVYDIWVMPEALGTYEAETPFEISMKRSRE